MSLPAWQCKKNACCSVLQCAAGCYSVLQCAAVRCSVLQRAAMRCTSQDWRECARPKAKEGWVGRQRGWRESRRAAAKAALREADDISCLKSQLRMYVCMHRDNYVYVYVYVYMCIGYMYIHKHIYVCTVCMCIDRCVYRHVIPPHHVYMQHTAPHCTLHHTTYMYTCRYMYVYRHVIHIYTYT